MANWEIASPSGRTIWFIR